MMNTKSKLKVIYAESVIEMNTTFAKMMQNPLRGSQITSQRSKEIYNITHTPIDKNINNDEFVF